MPKLEIILLGTPAITVNGKPIEVASNFVRALLVFLVIEKHHPHRREVLAEMLWPGKPEGAARNSLKQAISNLRMALGDRDNGDPFLLVSGEEIQFNQSSQYWVDAEAFTEIIQTCDEHPHNELSNCEVCRDCYRRTTDLYQGDFLTGFYLPDNQDFNDWVTLRREVFQRWITGALNKLALIYEGRGEFTNAIEYSRQLTDLEPWNEENHRNLMRLLALNGMRSAALRHYQVCCESLRDELDVEPSNATITLYEEIKAWEPGVFPNQELSQINPISTDSKLIPEPDTAEKSTPIRKLTRRSLLWLIAASLILGIGSVYWIGLSKRFGTTTDPGEQALEQIPIAVGASTDTLPPTVTERDTAEAISAATQVSTKSVVSTSTQTASTVDREADLQALTALYQQTGGSNWSNDDGWLSERSPCEWYGITCRGEKIVKLDLSNNQLKGNIPSEMGSLSNLEYLVLSGNSELIGPIPPELGQLSDLLHLELASEEVGSLLSGQIPTELGNLLNLEVFVIQNSLISGPLPMEIYGLIKLKVLDLGNNQLSGTILPEIGNLVDLENLDLGGNAYMSGPIPPEIGKLIRLQYLYLGDSNLSGTLPPEIGNLSGLRVLQIDGNPLFGPLPKTLTNINNQHFRFDRTSLCEPPDEDFQAWLDGIVDLHSSKIVCE
jgi:DNA-binding SARP family transcriptional activator